MGVMRRSASPSCRAGLLAAVFATGCNLLTGASDLSFDQGSGPGTGSGDAQPDVGAVVPEGGEGPRDAAADGNGDARPAAPTCAPGAIFCDDFDGADGLKKWGSLKIGGGTSAIDGVAAVSAPSSLLMSWPSGAGTTVGVELQADIAKTAKLVRLSFSARVESLGGKDGDALGVAQINIGTTYSIRLAVQKSGDTQLEEIMASGSGGPSNVTTALLSRRLPQTNTFATIEITVSLDGFPAATVQIGGQSAGTKPLTGASGTLGISLGDRDVAASNNPWRIRYDNVVVIAQ